MIIAPHRAEVIANIRQNIDEKRFNDKVEIDDPNMTLSEQKERIQRYLKQQKTAIGHLQNSCARLIYNAVTYVENRQTKIEGMDNLNALSSRQGAIITSNHFNPLENTIIRYLTKKEGHRRLYIVNQVTNLGMDGLIGFLMNHLDMIPLCSSVQYLGHQFPQLISQVLADGHFILMYPEQEMWFNYRKPRPLKRGTYYYAAQNQVPIVSCFVSLKNQSSYEPKSDFHRVDPTLHVLPIIFPDPEKSVLENSQWMMEKDYQQKKTAYEAAYQKPLDYTFSPSDIAGWTDE